jgi:hypothetical protein
MGTPHSGAGLADWAKALAKFLGIFQRTNTGILGVLQQNSEILARIQEDFYTTIRARSKQGKTEITIICFYEELPLQGIGVVCFTLLFLITFILESLDPFSPDLDLLQDPVAN